MLQLRSLRGGPWHVVADFVSGGHRYLLLVEAPTEPVARLSKRERDVLARAAEGRSNTTIASDLRLSPSTVRVLIARACRKLGVGSRSAGVELFRRNSK